MRHFFSQLVIFLGFKRNYILFTFVNSYSMVSIQQPSLFCGRGETNVQKLNKKNLWVICGILRLDNSSSFLKPKFQCEGGLSPTRVAPKGICSAFSGYVYKTEAAASCNSPIFPFTLNFSRRGNHQVGDYFGGSWLPGIFLPGEGGRAGGGCWFLEPDRKRE